MGNQQVNQKTNRDPNDQRSSLTLSISSHDDFHVPKDLQLGDTSLNNNTLNSPQHVTLLNCFALGDDMIHYLWRFYDKDRNDVLDRNEMRIFLAELIQTLHDVCVRSEINAHEMSHRKEAAKNPVNLSTESVTTPTTIVDEESVGKKKSSFFKRKKKTKEEEGKQSVRASVDFNVDHPTNHVGRFNAKLSDAALKRRSVAVVPAAHLDTDFESYLTGKSEHDEIRKKWNAIKERMENDIETIITQADTDGDGSIQYNEFISFMKTFDLGGVVSPANDTTAPFDSSQPLPAFGKDEDKSSTGSGEDITKIDANTVNEPPQISSEQKRQSLQLIIQKAAMDESNLPALDLPPSSQQSSPGLELYNLVVYGSNTQVQELLTSSSSLGIEQDVFQKTLRRAVTDNNPSKTRILLKYGANLETINTREETNSGQEGGNSQKSIYDPLIGTMLGALPSYSPCMDDSEMQRFLLILRLLISKGLYKYSRISPSTSENEGQLLNPELLYDAIIQSNSSMSMYEDELKEALSEEKSFDEVEQDYSHLFED